MLFEANALPRTVGGAVSLLLRFQEALNKKKDRYCALDSAFGFTLI